ncbi:MAG: alpha/beta fold hydrolase [Chroococcidiopsis sp.]
MKRRNFLASSTLALSTSVAFGRYRVSAASPVKSDERSKAILLIHGAWHSSLHWNKVSSLLTGMGHHVVAVDLPGHGLNTKFPASYLRQDLAVFSTEESPLKAIAITDYVNVAIEAVRALAADRKVTVVGHSMGGLVITQLDNAIPLALQDLMIRQADALTPGNKFNVQTLNSSHSPFASQPKPLSNMLDRLP